MNIGNVKIHQLSELAESEGEKCIIIGTLYKHQQNKPSILKELSEDEQLVLPVVRDDYCSDDDQVFLEDDTSRIKLVGNNVNIKDIVTGVVCAVLGHQDENSSFKVWKKLIKIFLKNYYFLLNYYLKYFFRLKNGVFLVVYRRKKLHLQREN